MADNKITKSGVYRSTHSVLLDTPRFKNMHWTAKYTYLALKHSRLNNRAGIFLFGKGELVTLSDLMGIPSKRVREGIDILSEIHYAIEDDGVLWFRNQLKHDPSLNLRNENHKTSIERVLENLPAISLVAKFCNYYRLSIPSGIPSRYHRDTISDTFKSIEEQLIPDSGQRRTDNGELKADMSSEFSDEVRDLADLLKSLILRNKSDRKGIAQTWMDKTSDAIDKMIRLDKRDPDEIREIIEWCQSDNEPRGTSNFCWAPNILSGKALRKQFDRLQVDMQKSKPRAKSDDDLIREVAGE